MKDELGKLFCRGELFLFDFSHLFSDVFLHFFNVGIEKRHFSVVEHEKSVKESTPFEPDDPIKMYHCDLPQEFCLGP